MPLGVFIKPSQEKMACDGKRAFHMCSMMSSDAAAHVDKSGRVAFANQASGLEKHAKAQSAGGDEFLPAVEVHENSLSGSFLSDQEFLTPDFSYILRIDRPPQVL